MNPTLQLFAPKEEDLATLLDMMEDFNRIERIPFDRTAATPALRHVLEDASLGLVTVAALDGALVGYGIVTYGYDLEYGGRDAFLTEVYLSEVARGRGLGATLMAGIEERARAAGVQALHLLVRPDNAPARALYQKVGFATSPRLVMTKRLT